MSPARVLIIAGENSGDKHGASLVQAFREIDPSVEFFGVGGARMREAGVRLINTVEDLAVVGIFEILSQLPRIRHVFTRIKREARSQKPQAAILIDSPDFNLRLARFLKKQRIPVLYYIGPTVWAWRKNRLKTIRKTVDKMMLIFPFEQPLYHEHGIASVFVGHPLPEQIGATAPREEVFHRYGFDPDRPLLVLLPGSRRSEIRYHMPTLMATAVQLRAESRAHFALLLAENLDAETVRKFIPRELEQDIRVLDNPKDYHDVLAAGDLALSACGTANLEAALLETPVLAFYRISPLTYTLGKPFVKVDRYSISRAKPCACWTPVLSGKRWSVNSVRSGSPWGSLERPSGPPRSSRSSLSRPVPRTQRSRRPDQGDEPHRDQSFPVEFTAAARDEDQVLEGCPHREDHAPSLP